MTERRATPTPIPSVGRTSLARENSEIRFLSVDAQVLLALYSSTLAASEIYRCVTASQPTISKRLAHLMDRGLIGVSTRADDRRVNMYFITAEGRQALRNQIEETIGPIWGSLRDSKCENIVPLFRQEEHQKPTHESATR